VIILGAGDAVNSTYVISTGSAIVRANIGADDTFYVNNVPATQTVFLGIISGLASDQPEGLPASYNADTGEHRVTLLSEEQILASGWTVGYDIDLTSGEFSLIEPFSGAEISSADIDDADVLRIGNSTVDRAAFDAAINAGDTVAITETSGGDIVYTLHHGNVSGEVTDANPVTVSI